MLFGKRERLIERILVVEDEPLVAFDNEHGLEQAGHAVIATVDRVRDAVAVLESAGDHGPQLIIADIRLTGERSGIDLARLVKPAGIPVLFATGSLPDDARQEQLGIGWLAKPFASRDLVRAIEACEAVLAGRDPGKLPAGLELFVGIGAKE